MKNLLSLEGKLAIVTGAAKGIGENIATLYRDHGAGVVICDIDDDCGAATAERLGATYRHCDISRQEDVQSLFEFTETEIGPVDILVNNAGCGKVVEGGRASVEEFRTDVWLEKIDIDLNGTFFCCRQMSERMVARGSGCIINIASIAGVVALQKQIAHDACKAAIIKMTECMAIELGPKGIRCNAISPGSTVTAATKSLFYADDGSPNPAGQELLTFIPLRRPGETRDIAGAALYLASDLASYVNGHNLVVDGGWIAGFNRNF
jgi:NAD(P)-dependent dehydrogenase (short-subunit alcohol dehydrogenase family)